METLSSCKEVTLVFPAYNEAGGIEQAVFKAKETLANITKSFEIIIAEDGSTDGTGEIAKRLSTEIDSVLHLHNDKRLGRGRALKRAFKSSTGAILVYMDVDLSAEMNSLESLINSIKNGYDVVTGSRMLPDSLVQRSLLRTFASRAYNGLVRFLLGSPVRDHQCGFKAFKRESLFRILDKAKDDHWFWDTEILILAVHYGFRVNEIPITWREGKTSRVELISDSMNMGFHVLSLWWRLKGEKTLFRKK
ncbi:glycosyltransferase family 2 protein [Candidatus Bathyarchaeota archaeon]|nr:glycosyltransferase family 2 protein [Candidatus Bathyarchaeota archaeon]